MNGYPWATGYVDNGVSLQTASAKKECTQHRTTCLELGLKGDTCMIGSLVSETGCYPRLGVSQEGTPLQGVCVHDHLPQVETGDKMLQLAKDSTSLMRGGWVMQKLCLRVQSSDAAE